MGERKGQNKYYPPDFDPKKHRSLDAYHGTHALRERARKLNQGILIIRFEMPYNIWCDGCNNPIGMGVRYNAEKSKVGMYYTTPLYNFRMKCHLCDNHFEIKTDPANHDYVITSGARRKEQRWDPKENEQIVPEDKETQKKLARDAMYKLEHGAEDKSKSREGFRGISQLAKAKKQWKDDYSLNKLIRQQFREKKKQQISEEDRDKALLAKSSLAIELVPEQAEDKKMAHLLQYKTVESFDEKQKQKRDEIESRSIFQTATELPASPLTSPSSSSGSSNTSSGTQQWDCHKHQVARKRLGNILSKNKPNPFRSESVSSKTKSKLSPASSESFGILRKRQRLRNDNNDDGNMVQISCPTHSGADPNGCKDVKSVKNADKTTDQSTIIENSAKGMSIDSSSNSDKIIAANDIETILTKESNMYIFQNSSPGATATRSLDCSTSGNALNTLISNYSDSEGDSDE